MKTIALDDSQSPTLHLLQSADDEPVLVSTPDGQRYLISHADDLQTEVELLRCNQKFLSFLDEAKQDTVRYDLEAVRRILREEDAADELLENDERFTARVAEARAEFRDGKGIPLEEVKRIAGVE